MSVIRNYLALKAIQKTYPVEKDEFFDEDELPNADEKIEDTADLLAELGVIHDTPHAKYRWINS